jgi:leader peptidase (prepilin peptidase) / N-methyltransferase
VTAVVIVFLGVLGGAVGAALEVVVDRVPRRLPVRGWEPADTRPSRAVLVTIVTAGLYAGLAARYHDSFVLPAYLLLAAGLVALSVIDLEHFLLPNRIVYPLDAAVPVLLAVAAAGDDDWSAFGRALLAGVVAVTAFGALHLVSPRSLGLGDVKLVAALGTSLGWLGWGALAVGAVLGFAIGAVVGLALVLAGRLGRRDHLPFGPFLAAGTLVTLLLQLPR